MIVAECDIWQKYEEGKTVCVCVSGCVNAHGEAIMATGTEGQAARRFPEITRRLGRFLRTEGMHVCFLRERLLAFPTKYTGKHPPNLSVISQSFRELARIRKAYEWERVFIPFPGGRSLTKQVGIFLRGTDDWIVLCLNDTYAAQDKERVARAYVQWHKILAGKTT